MCRSKRKWVGWSHVYVHTFYFKIQKKINKTKTNLHKPAYDLFLYCIGLYTKPLKWNSNILALYCWKHWNKARLSYLTRNITLCRVISGSINSLMYVVWSLYFCTFLFLLDNNNQRCLQSTLQLVIFLWLKFVFAD